MKWFVLTLGLLGTALAQEHPRLLFTRKMEAEVKQRIAADPLAAGLQQEILRRAGEVLGQRTCEYRIPDGKRLLGESRLALHHVLHEGWAWRMTGEEKYRERVIRELDAACALPNWNPSHFLDVAEMSTAVAIGYDWLYATLTAEQRKRYEDHLIQDGLKPLQEKYLKTGWWVRPSNNWSQVCGTGMWFAAEMVREREPELAGNIQAHARELMTQCVAFYQPDGAYPEGPAYWDYGTNYQVLFFAAAAGLGKPVEISPLYRKSGAFMGHLVGPTGYTYNYADGNPALHLSTPAQSWIASHFQDAGLARQVRENLKEGLARRITAGPTGDVRFLPLHLLWLPAEPKSVGADAFAATFAGEQSLAFLRTGEGKQAAWLAAKGGTGAASHGHLDAGSFVYEAGGVRWFHDLGSDDYNLPGYFGKARWDYLRLNSFSHNTLVIGNQLQEAPKEGCPLSEWKVVDGQKETTIDLTRAYSKQAKSVLRRMRMSPATGEVEVRDELLEPTGEVRWAVVTKAKVTTEGKRVRFEEGGKKLVLERQDALGGEWQEFSLTPTNEKEKQNKEFRMIGFKVPASAKVALQVRWKLE